MTNILDNKPAFSGLKIYRPKIIESVKNQKNFFLKKIFFNNKHTRFFFMKKKNKNFFLKIVPKNQSKFVNFQLYVHKWLIKKKINVPNLLIDKNIKVLNSKYFNHYLLRSEFLKNDIIKFNKKTLAKFACELSNFHDKLKKIPLRKKIQVNTLKRIKTLEINKTKFLSRKINRKKFRKVYNLLKNENLFFDFVKKNFNNFQPTHGDLIPANIIYTKNKKIFTFIDLEDMFYSFFPIEFDLSLFIERTILKLNISNKKKIEFVKIFLLNYFRNNKKKLQFPIVESIKFNSLKSILMLITIYNNKNKLNKKELNKFIDLYYSKINFLKKIDQEYLSYDKN